MKIRIIIACLVTVFLPYALNAQMIMREIMFDPAGSDTGREWILLENTSDKEISFKDIFILEEGVRHKLTTATSTSGEVFTSIKPGERFVVADSPVKFIVDYPDYKGGIFDSVFSLKNTGETIQLFLKEEMLSEFIPSMPFGETGDGRVHINTGDSWRIGLSSLAGAGTQAAGSVSTSTTVDILETKDSQSVDEGVWIEQTVPKLTVHFNAPKKQTAGVVTVFRASAFIKDKELGDAVRFVWNFGNGVVKEGSSVAYGYPQPGKYAISVTAVSDRLSGTTYQAIEVRRPKISIKERVPGERGFIVLENSEKDFVEISGYLLRSGVGLYAFPANTFLAPAGSMTLIAQDAGITIDDSIEVLYPNGEFLVR